MSFLDILSPAQSMNRIAVTSFKVIEGIYIWFETASMRNLKTFEMNIHIEVILWFFTTFWCIFLFQKEKFLWFS